MTTGQQVVCVDDAFPDAVKAAYRHLPVKHCVYRVRGMALGVNANNEPGEVVVYLAGVVNPCSTVPPHPERGFSEIRFKPVAELTPAELAAVLAVNPEALSPVNVNFNLPESPEADEGEDWKKA